jgi:very-short-patch-repair endonuclease/DNA polymerase III delta prime subunit
MAATPSEERLDPSSPAAKAALLQLKALRQKLLDLSTRNRLISFKHSARSSKSFVRVVDSNIKDLFEHLTSGKSVEMVPLPHPPNEPADEKNPYFQDALEEALLTDKKYLNEIELIEAKESDDSDAKTRSALRGLKDRIRKKLKMPHRSDSMLKASEWAEQNKINPDFDLSSTRRSRPASKWQTLIFEEDLTRALRSLWHGSREAQNEYGINTLNCIFGFLEWSQKTPGGEAEEVIFSPIILAPIEVKPRQKKGITFNGRLLLDAGGHESLRGSKEDYIISAESSDEPYVNLALKERLREDYGILIPDWDEENPNLEVFFEQVRRAIAGHPKWSVREFVTLSHLSFSRYPMWLDTDPDATGANITPPHLHPVVGELLGGKDDAAGQNGDLGNGDNESSDGEINSSDEHIPFVMDIDLSQQDAIRLALKGTNIVIQGPPGTGKSQTIANLIAAALDRGKTVLFVAEKQVALEVVYKRLAEVGIGEFVLQLHSAKGSKQSVLQSIKDRLELDQPFLNYELDKLTRKNVAELGGKLNEYAIAMNTLFGVIDKSVHDIIWEEIKLKDQPIPQGLRGISFNDVEEWTREQWKVRVDAVKEWEEVVALLKSDPIYDKWGWVENANLYADDHETILNLLATAACHATDLQEITINSALISGPSSWASLEHTLNSVELLTNRPEAQDEMWSFAKSSDAIKEAETVCSAFIITQEEVAWLEKEIPDLPSHTNREVERLVRLSDLRIRLKDFYELTTLEALGNEKALYDYIKAILPQGTQILKDLSELMSFPALIEISDAFSFSAKLFVVASRTPPEIIGRYLKLEDSESRKVLAEFIMELRLAKQERQESQEILISKTCVMPSVDLFEAAKTLKEGGLFAWLLKPAYRRASFLASTLFGKKTKNNWPELLSKLAECRLKAEKLDVHPALEILGSLFSGIDTDIELINRIYDWSEMVLKSTPATSMSMSHLRNALFTCSLDICNFSMEKVAENWHEAFEMLARITEKHHSTPNELIAVLEQYNKAVDETFACCVDLGLKSNLDEAYLNLIKAHLQRLLDAKAIINSKPTASKLLLPDTDLRKGELESLLCWLNTLENSGLSQEIINKLGSNYEFSVFEQIHSGCCLIRQAHVRLRDCLKSIQIAALQTERNAATWKTAELCVLATKLRDLSNDSNGFQIRSRLIKNQIELSRIGLNEFICNAAKEKCADSSGVVALFNRIAVRCLCRKALRSFPILREFELLSPKDIQEKFQENDKELHRLNKRKIISKLQQRNVPRGVSVGRVKDKTEKGLIDHMVNTENPRTSLRELMKRSARALQGLKPCFMMSPLSVAQLINRGKIVFDMVIFDEASQIRPEDAVSSLLRAKQFVIVGDRMQLPPTNFGMKSSTSSLSDDEEETEEDLEQQQSILDLATTNYGCGAMLKRHYRSRDPALICFSNREFYDNQLEIFPAPFNSGNDTGVKYVHVEGVYAHRRNLIEALKTASEVVEYMKKYPNRSIGVVATNKPQAELIEYELNKLIASDSTAGSYERKWDSTMEPLFVKNLESVQGDERDVIFISTVFGKDEDGNFFQRFGPINSVNGHRRLNVLFTRAKYQIIVISSVPVQDIQITKQSGSTAHRGVSVFRKYLEYASSGQLAPESKITNRGYDSPFEQAVSDALRLNGYECISQIGVKGFFIDLAVRHPDNPDKFILGIECDGATYHSSRVARDRDRLRQEILERLGWKLHRIWSTDWLANQQRELDKLKAKIDIALSEA